MELADLRNPRESYDEDELFDGVRSPGWEPDSKIMLQLEMSQKVAIFNTVLPFINLVLLLQLYNSHPGPTTQSLFLALTFCVFISACSIVWVYHCSDRIQYSLRPNLTVTGIICLSTGTLGVYFLGLFMRLIFYQDEHIAYLKGQLASPEVWKKYYGQHTFEQESAIQRSKLNWSVPSSLFLAVSQIFISFIARKIYLTFSMRTYGLNKLLLIITGLLSMFVSWEIYYWSRQANFISSTLLLGLDLKKSAMGLLTLSFLLMILITCNVCLAVRKHKKSYVVFAVTYFFAYVFVAMCTFSAISHVRKYHIKEDVSLRNCKDLAISVHEDKLRPLCPFGDKYLAPGVRCGKEELTIRWETGLQNHEVRTLNPSCCEMARYYYINPHTRLSHLGIMLCILLIVLVLVNLSLWKNSNSLFYIFPKLWENLGAVAVVGLLVGFFVYISFQSQHKSEHQQNTEMLSYTSPSMFPSPGFTLVPPDLSEKFKGQLCFDNKPELYPFPKPDPKLEKGKPVMRIAILALSSYVKIKHNKEVSVGPKNSSDIFFPGCDTEIKTHNLSSFKVIYGSSQQVRDSLANAIFCTTAMLKDSARVVYSISYWGPDQLDKNGLTHKENLELLQSTNTTNNKCSPGTGQFFPAKFGARTSIKGRLVFRDSITGKESPVHPQILITAFEVLDNDQVLPIVQANTVILQDSIFIVSDIVRLYEFDSTVRLHFTDPLGVYINKTVDVLVAKSESGVLELSAGVIRLLTQDGNRCALEDIVCKTKQMTQTGTIKVVFSKSPIKRKTYMGARIFLYKDFTITNKPMVQETWKNDTWESQAIPYGSYSVVVLKSKHLPRIERVDLQSATSAVVTINLRRSYGNHQMTIINEVFEDKVDLDLMVVIKGQTNRECTISPYNKYCAYGKMFTKSKDSIHRKDAVILKNLAVATYVAYSAPSPSYSKSCTSDMYELAIGNHITNADILPSWNWHAVQGSTPLSSIPVLGHFKYNDDFDPTDPLIWPKLRNSMQVEDVVETFEQSKRSRIIMSSHPRKLNRTSTLTPYLVDTDVRYTLKNKGVLDLGKLRNWNIAATTAVNSQENEWEMFNYSKILNDSVLNDKTIWPELENNTMMVMPWNNSTPATLEYNQTLPNGQKSVIREGNATKPSGGTNGQWMSQIHTFRNETEYPNKTSAVGIRWWSALIDPKDKHVVSNTSEHSEDTKRPNGDTHHHRSYFSIENFEPEVKTRKLFEVEENKTGNVTMQSSLSKLIETDTRANVSKRTLINCKEELHGKLSMRKNCTSNILNRTTMSGHSSVSISNVSQSFNQTLLEMVEKYNTTPLVMRINSTFISQLGKGGLITQNTRRRKEERDSKQNKLLLVENYLSQVQLNDALGTKNLSVKDSSATFIGDDVFRSVKAENTSMKDHGLVIQSKIHFWDNKTTENRSIVITTKVDKQMDESPLLGTNITKKVIKNKDLLNKVSLDSVTVSTETLHKYLGFKQNYTLTEDAATSKKGKTQYVTETKTRIINLYQPGTNVTTNVSNATITAKRSHQGGVWQTDHTKSELNLSRSLPPVIGVFNQTVMNNLDNTPWAKSEANVQAKKICPVTKASCSIDLKGSALNTTIDSVYSSANLVLSKSKNSKGHTVLSQSIILAHSNDTKNISWDLSVLLDQITKPNQELVQSTNVLHLTVNFPKDASLAQMLPQNNSIQFFGNASTLNKEHGSLMKTFVRNYTDSSTKKWTKTVEYAANSSGKVGQDLYVHRMSLTHTEEQLMNGSVVTNHSMTNSSEGKAAEGFMLDIFNMTGAKLIRNFTLQMNATNSSIIGGRGASLVQRIIYLNSTKIEDHSIFTKIEAAETIDIADDRHAYREARHLRKSIVYKANNLESEVLTNQSIEKNKQNETYIHSFRVLVHSIDLNKPATDPTFKKQISIYEKSFLILPDGKIQVLKEHVFPEDLKRESPLLPPIPTLVSPAEIPSAVPPAATDFQVSMFDIDGVDLSLVRNPQMLGLKRAPKNDRKLQLQSFGDELGFNGHLRTPRAAADARLRKISQKLKLPTPTFSKNSVDTVYGVDKSQFFLIACFTGYGAPSVMQLNEYTVDRPTPAECETRLGESRKKRYLVEHLQREIQEYEEGHPEYIDLRNPGAKNVLEVDSIDQLEIADFNIETF